MSMAKALTGELYPEAPFLTTRAYQSGAGSYKSGMKEYAREYVARLKDYVKGMAKKTGIIPEYRKTKHLLDEIEEPQYMTHPEIQRRTTRPLVRKMRDYYGSKFDMAPYISRVKEYISGLPVYAALWRGKDGRIRGKPAGVVQGEFNPDTNTITVNPAAYSRDEIKEIYRNSPKTRNFYLGLKDWLESHGVRLSSPAQIKAHELGHYFQKVSGAIGRYRKKGWEAADRLWQKYRVPKARLADFISRTYIEGANTIFTNRMTGREDSIYPRERQKFRKLADRWGELKAYLGLVPAEELEHAVAA